MVLDSSGTCDGERRMAVGNALGQRGSKCATAAPWKSPMMAWSTACDDYFRVTTRPGWSGFPVRFSFQHWFGNIHFPEPASLET
jgi:hypothetical protein